MGSNKCIQDICIVTKVTILFRLHCNGLFLANKIVNLLLTVPQTSCTNIIPNSLLEWYVIDLVVFGEGHAPHSNRCQWTSLLGVIVKVSFLRQNCIIHHLRFFLLGKSIRLYLSFLPTILFTVVKLFSPCI
jgi:hypothetical protein